ncbi:hypothetical protein V8E55_005037 [Tylopilus felleus]
MHRALQIEDILYSIFHHFVPVVDMDMLRCELPDSDPVLPALARTCRAFKEPAMNALWMVLNDLSPLVTCIKASRQLSSRDKRFFRRHPPLTQTDWDSIQSYTRRVRCIHDFRWLPRLHKYLKLLSNPPSTEPLFPNLRYLCCRYDEMTMHLLNLPFPSLIYLEIAFQNPKLFRESFKSFPKLWPNIRELSFHLEDQSGSIEPNYICHWQNLCSVDAHFCPLDMNDLEHLSRMPALTKLEFALRRTLPDFNTPLSFSNLRHLTLYSNSLPSISRLLLQIRLPAITDFDVWIEDCPSKQELASFFAGVRASNAGHTIKQFGLIQERRLSREVRSALDMEDMRPCMEFRNLCGIAFRINYNVCLTNSDLLTLASVWPKLEYLQINASWGWKSQYGVTPGGLVQLLQMCPLLNCIILRLDTQGYTEATPCEISKSLRLPLQHNLTIDILDAAIEAESAPAVDTFFSDIAACCESGFHLRYRNLKDRLPRLARFLDL